MREHKICFIEKREGNSQNEHEMFNVFKILSLQDQELTTAEHYRSVWIFKHDSGMNVFAVLNSARQLVYFP